MGYPILISLSCIATIIYNNIILGNYEKDIYIFHIMSDDQNFQKRLTNAYVFNCDK